MFGEQVIEENYTITNRMELSSSGEEFVVSELIFNYYDNLTIGNYICQGFNNVTNLVGAIDEAIGSFYIEGISTIIYNTILCRIKILTRAHAFGYLKTFL